ncbi:MAG: sel1 repeat family protein [Muribaculaceae bacterium]|nr:sel1 repeat family protein [Muribaculaceae bacterium]
MKTKRFLGGLVFAIIALMTISVSAMASEFSPQKRSRTTTSRQGKVNTKNPTSAAEQNALGVQYANNNDAQKAIYWFTKAAEQGYTPAQCNLGDCYNMTIGSFGGDTYNESKAVYWLRKAAEKGDCVAQDALGDCYMSGSGVPCDYKLAVYWFSKSAQQDYRPAQIGLADCYKYGGHGITKDLDKEAYWRKKGCSPGGYEPNKKMYVDWSKLFDKYDDI